MRFALVIFLALGLSAHEPVRARKAMVVTQDPIATDVGVGILKRGGNAYDAAVAVAFALAVTYPTAGNIGGGGFALVRSANGEANFIDFREKAPGQATRDMYLDAQGKPTRDSVVGWRASGVPGTVRGLELLHKKYGKLPWAELVKPSVKLAKNGFVLSYATARSIRGSERTTGPFPESKRIYLKGGSYYEAGETLRLPELARTLDRIAKRGPSEFYQGETAKRLAAEMAKHGGLVTEADLRNYQAVERKPLLGHYHGHEIIAAPPPSSGGIGMLQMMGMLEHLNPFPAGMGSAKLAHTLAEVMRRYYADRSQFLGDPDFVKVPVAGLLNPKYIAQRADSITDRATPSASLQHGAVPPEESPETTHLSIVDAQGNAVSLTYTLNGSYGSGVTVPGLGFLLNNEMDDFSAKPGVANMFGALGGEANAIAPGKRMLSSMTPTIVTKDGKLLLVIGAPGGTRIITGVMQAILNVIDYKLNVQDAIDAPRLHHQWMPDRLYLERGWSPDTVELLKKMGHNVETGTMGVSNVHGILVEEKWLQGAPDGRSNGKAAGY
ncbi:gamma-glutamyltransferase [Bryobacter aggregatus]|uniref:gamma-glutamyltransferase n=1 Tax=Bryobacter aggregatus TaxID=360054 RepID=UPI0004E11CE2|nr:gamma-glutamyltransferase [Bryobacter aggregatus]